jgi:hypothetical protein
MKLKIGKRTKMWALVHRTGKVYVWNPTRKPPAYCATPKETIERVEVLVTRVKKAREK